MLKIELSKHSVEVKEELSWYEIEEVKALTNRADVDRTGQKATVTGQGQFEAKIKLMELAIVSITEKEGGAKIPFSVDWLKTLNLADGNKLADHLETLDGKKA